MPYETVDPRAAHTRQQQGWIYVDVRTPEEFAAGHPKGAVNVPIVLFGRAGAQSNPRFLDAIRALYPSDARLLMGCKSGGRSANACAALAAAGYTALANVDGGFLGSPMVRGWEAEGLPVSTDATGDDGTAWDAVLARLS